MAGRPLVAPGRSPVRLRLPAWKKHLQAMKADLSRPLGGRLGEAAVVSTCLHGVDGRQPEEVAIFLPQDAGQVFYGRTRRGEVVHMDIFHQVGAVDPRAVARSVREALGDHLPLPSSSPTLLDLVDIQTGVGGGRLTGSLTFGQKLSLRRAHLHHVHLALLWPPSFWDLLPLVAGAVEAAILSAGLELRKVERVVAYTREGDRPFDLSPYGDVTDSWIREARPQDADAFSLALWLAERQGGVEAALSLLEEGGGEGALPPWLLSRWPLLFSMGPRGWERSSLGDEVRRILRDEGAEIRRALRGIRRESLAPGRKGGSWGGRGRRRQVGPLRGSPWWGIAPAETFLQAFRQRPHGPLPLRPDDFQVVRRRHPPSLDWIILIDASASMAGHRIQAAKDLVRHLARKSRDRIAVASFQNREVTLHVPLTRHLGAVEKGLEALRPAGLTPLAQALLEARTYVEGARPSRPLILLITDGIPTVSRGQRGPLEDALAEAEELGRRRIPFTCVGLEPNRAYLEELAQRAGGRLYILPELEKEELFAIARREGRRIRGTS
ncbi:MAG: VWA domain-containing protein [Clostridiales bacterium]|nr:VWA domain-containing protein [Clostridiales bacterium]